MVLRSDCTANRCSLHTTDVVRVTGGWFNRAEVVQMEEVEEMLDKVGFVEFFAGRNGSSVAAVAATRGDIRRY